jgi:phosphoribosyl-AMP cyclohydrolase / phosphoribosyl-ATP pyrophosphohydrolase
VSNLQFLDTLQAVIRDRLAAASPGSYTARLAAQGPLKVAQKLGEEGVELALAAVAEDDVRVTEEAADLVYHMLVLLALRGISFDDVVVTLEKRHV